MVVGEVIAQLRKDRGIFQKDLADLLHVSIGTISNYETGVRMPDLDSINKLANYFSVSIDYLTGRTGLELPLSEFEQEYANGVRTDVFFNRVSKLSPFNRIALLEYIGLLELKEKQSS